MAWAKKNFDAAGLTQFPPGSHWGALRDALSGTVVLCIDVSGSMSLDGRLSKAIAGGERFIDEAVANNYRVGLIAWHHSVDLALEPGTEVTALKRILRSFRPVGGNDIQPTLERCESWLDGLVGDRVVAIFGDGDLGNPDRARTAARRLTQKNIRILTMGLGDASARSLGEIASDVSQAMRTSPESMADDIAAMGGLLKPK